MAKKWFFNPFIGKLDYYETGGGGKGWELIKSGSFTNSFNLTGLNGDVDKLYKLILVGVGPARTYDLRLNNDSGQYNYDWVKHFAGFSGGNPIHDVDRSTGMNRIPLGHLNRERQFIEITIQARTTLDRLIKISNHDRYDNTTFAIVDIHAKWYNTANITQINIILSGAIDVGQYWLFRVVE